MIEAVWIIAAFTLGLLVRAIGLPSLIGYLAAGFFLAGFGDQFGIGPQDSDILGHLSHLGVLLLLFTVGLKLKVKNLLHPEILGGGLIHFIISTAVFTAGMLWFLDISLNNAIMLSIALSFSSTVLAAKGLEAKRELRAFHGRVAIGVLIVQDLIALTVMSIASGASPSPWAILILAIPLLRPLLYRLLDASGHDELLVLLGLLLALVVGGAGFELLGLSSELGALAFGALLANHQRAGELSDALWSIKEIFLVGFFLQIGINGLPDSDAVIFALVMAVLLPFKSLLFYFLFVFFKLRSRSAFLASVSLANYSEFGLIVASVVLPQWLVPLAITVAVSFVISAPLNRVAHHLYEKLAHYLLPFERDSHHPDQQPVALRDTEVLVMGLGRTGRAAYDHIKSKGLTVMGLDSDPLMVTKSQLAGRQAMFADAEDQLFWQALSMPQVRAVVLTINDPDAKIVACKQLRQRHYRGLIVSYAMFEDIAEQIRQAGADHTYLTMSEAGVGLAERVMQNLPAAADTRVKENL